jgi:selenide,water dikinase
MLTRGDKNNRTYVGNTVAMSDNVSSEMQSALYDPQTAGGLLVSLPAAEAAEFIRSIDGARVIGSVSTRRNHLIEVN